MNGELVWRPPTLADMPEITGLASRCDAAYGTLDATVVDSLTDRLRWDSSFGDFSRVVVGREGIAGAGWARNMWTLSEERVCLYAFGAPEQPEAFDSLMVWLKANYPAAWDPAIVLRIERVIAPSTADLPATQIALYESFGFERFYVELEMACDLEKVVQDRTQEIAVSQWAEDLHPRIREAYNEAFRDPEFEGYAPEEWERAFHAEDFRRDLSFAALDGDRVVGFVFSRLLDDPDEWTDPAIRGGGWIDSLGVVPSHQNRGIAAGLLSETMIALREAGAERAILRVNENNLRARRLYEKLGFDVARKHVVYRK